MLAARFQWIAAIITLWMANLAIAKADHHVVDHLLQRNCGGGFRDDCDATISKCKKTADIKVIHTHTSTVFRTYTRTTEVTTELSTETVTVTKTDFTTSYDETEGLCPNEVTVTDEKPTTVWVGVTVENVREFVPVTTKTTRITKTLLAIMIPITVIITVIIMITMITITIITATITGITGITTIMITIVITTTATIMIIIMVYEQVYEQVLPEYAPSALSLSQESSSAGENDPSADASVGEDSASQSITAGSSSTAIEEEDDRPSEASTELFEATLGAMD
ncbi:hypothetical protein NM208_g7396 [Fusarium decemcellulare]|uniref:Uncharacterized protein n=1 Tax=Fusarium decemcellulare TaxID=57161 RepID=A0ACC1S9D9_9HYPO|nr:hypothetical protein NM208_g7396 [Fusarium decemcellulare]